MPALAKIATAAAMALALTGGAAAIAQSTNAPQGHTVHISMIEIVPGSEDRTPVLTGQMPCDPPLHERLWRSWWGQEACDHDGYAYAYPNGYPAPWEGQVRWVNDSTHVDETGRMWHVAEVVYRIEMEAGESGQLVHAMASEILPGQPLPDGGTTDYQLPINEGRLDQPIETLVVGFGPAPTQR